VMRGCLVHASNASPGIDSSIFTWSLFIRTSLLVLLVLCAENRDGDEFFSLVFASISLFSESISLLLDFSSCKFSSSSFSFDSALFSFSSSTDSSFSFELVFSLSFFFFLSFFFLSSASSLLLYIDILFLIFFFSF